MQDNKNQLKRFRRQVIIKLAQAGNHTQGQIGQVVGLSQAMVSKVLCAYQKQGLAVLAIASPKGAVAKLSADQLAQLPALLDKGASSYGFQGQVWTRKRVGYVMEQKFGICYSERHVGRLLVKIGYSLQKPQLQDPKHAAEQVKQWQQEDLPALKKSPTATG
jgi:transposase